MVCLNYVKLLENIQYLDARSPTFEERSELQRPECRCLMSLQPEQGHGGSVQRAQPQPPQVPWKKMTRISEGSQTVERRSSDLMNSKTIVSNQLLGWINPPQLTTLVSCRFIAFLLWPLWTIEHKHKIGRDL